MSYSKPFTGSKILLIAKNMSISQSQLLYHKRNELNLLTWKLAIGPIISVASYKIYVGLHHQTNIYHNIVFIV